MEVRQVIRVKPLGTFSLSGSGMKTTGEVGWEYRCGACSATGPAAPKDPQEG